MLLLTHIIVAIITLVVVTWAYVSPHRRTLQLNYALAAITLVSGTILTILNPGHLVQSCLTGIVYFGIVSMVSLQAHRKLARLTA